MAIPRHSQAMLSGCVVATVTPTIQSGKQDIIPLGFHHDLLMCLAFRRPVRSVPYRTATHRRCHRTNHVRSRQPSFTYGGPRRIGQKSSLGFHLRSREVDVCKKTVGYQALGPRVSRGPTRDNGGSGCMIEELLSELIDFCRIVALWIQTCIVAVFDSVLYRYEHYDRSSYFQSLFESVTCIPSW